MPHGGEAQKAGIPFDFVLFDTWFSNPTQPVRPKTRNHKDWVRFVCTDMSLSKKEILETYMLHWKVEKTYFKLIKSYLKLRTECHSTSYDAITSHMVIVAIRYMILAVERFRNSDNRSLEELFYGAKCESVNELVDCAIVLMIDMLLDSIREYYHATETQVADLICLFISKLPENWKIVFRCPKCHDFQMIHCFLVCEV